MENLNDILLKSKNISDIARFVFGKTNYTNREKCKKILIENGINWKEWLEGKKVKTIKKCLYCGKILDNRNNKFCNHSCAASYNNSIKYGNEFSIEIKKEKQCLCCGKIINGNKKYCSQECANQHKYQEYIMLWRDEKIENIYRSDCVSNFIRRYLFEKNNCKCEKCGWGEKNQFTNKIPLQVHHIDGDCTNNKENNLQLLCPNCHSLTENFGSSNGHKSSRVDRRTKYFREDLKKDLKKDIVEISRCVICGKELKDYQVTFCSDNCHRRYYINNITKEDILKLFKENNKISFSKAAKKLKISVTTLGRKCLKYGIKEEIHRLRYKKY